MNRKLIVAGAAVLVVAGLFLWRGREENSREYYDKASGETVSDPDNRTPETFGRKGDEPVYLGTSKLLDVGVTSTQLAGTKLAFYNYSKQRKTRIKEVSVDINS